MKTFILISLLFFLGLAGFSTKWVIVNSGFTFSPATLTVKTTDSILFNVNQIHQPVEVSQATWNADGQYSSARRVLIYLLVVDYSCLHHFQ
jgi:hypothetical protein